MFPIVGIGASAGGLESLERFFGTVPERPGMAFVIVQHLSPNFKTMMDQLIARRTSLPVTVVRNGMEVRKDHVYLLPPGKLMMLVDKTLVLTNKSPDELVLPIDRFFESLAQSTDKAVAIVLSGTGSDGTMGIRRVKEHGGLVLAESNATAKFYGMPRSAIDTGVVDAVLPPEDMPPMLLRAMGNTEAPPEEALDGLSALLAAIRQRRDIDFSMYKHATLERRLARRAALAEEELDVYIARALNTPHLLDTLCDDFLINVTRFFRDGPCFDGLARELAAVFAQRKPDDEFRVWSVACATGEEPYSLAMIISELLTAQELPLPVKIFATDLNRRAIEFAARGRYDEDRLADVSTARLERFFRRTPDGFVIKKSIRDMIVFSPHDVLFDAPFTNLDLISCRNLLIYFNPSAQQKTLSYFHFGLRNDGLLMLGPSETTDQSGGFTPVDEPQRLYRRISFGGPSPIVAPRFRATPHRALRARSREPDTHHERLTTYEILCQRFMPPSVLLGSSGEVLELFGNAQRFLSIKPGRFEPDFLTLVDSDMKGSIAGALRTLQHDGKPLVVRSVRTQTADGPRQVSIEFERVADPDGQMVRYLASFTDESEVVEDEAAPSDEYRVSPVAQEELATLEAELARTREHLQVTVEELEASNEELQATNEELVASNEELQSTNEELSSVNEELYTVNTEYQNNIQQLREANADIGHLLSSTNIATLFLDQELKIRRFTPTMAQIIDLEPTDVGRRVVSFRHRLKWPGFYDTLEKVVAAGGTWEQELTHTDGRRLFVRIHTHDTAEGSEQGVAVTMTDVTPLARAQQQIRDRERRLARITDALPVQVAYVDTERRLRFVNEAFARAWGYQSRDDLLGVELAELVPPQIYAETKPHIESALQGSKVSYQITTPMPGGPRRLQVDYIPHFDGEDREVQGFYVASSDITDAHRFNQDLERARHEATQASKAKSEFLANMSHEIRTPLSAILGYAELLASEVDGNGAQQHVDTIRRNGRHLLSIINDLLELSRIEEDRLVLENVPFSLVDLVWGVHELFEVRARKKMLELQVDLPPQLPERVVSDPRRIRQILFNLMSNAIKFTHEGSIVLRVREDRTSAGAHVRFEVVDTGIGFPEEQAEELFQPFRQLDNSGSRRYSGSGLGLSICARLAEKLGGTLSAERNTNRGSCFTTRIPVGIPPDTPAISSDRPAPAPAAAAPGASTLPPAHVLVVDDNEDLRALVVGVLERAGATVTGLEAGTTALELVQERGVDAFDLVVMDVQMPGVDGLTITRRLRALGYEPPVIAVTARALPEDRDECLEAGCTDYLTKPLDLGLLVRKVGELLPAASGQERPAARCILVVEDDADSAEMLRLLLESRGFTVHTAGSCDQALEACARLRPSAVVSDLNLTEGSGIELAMALRGSTPPTRLIALSGADDRRDEALAAGFEHFLVKPCSIDRLVELLEG